MCIRDRCKVLKYGNFLESTFKSLLALVTASILAFFVKVKKAIYMAYDRILRFHRLQRNSNIKYLDRYKNKIEYEWPKIEPNSMIKINGNIFALSYTGSSNNSYLKTFNISNDGNDIEALGQNIHETTGHWHSLVKADDNTLVLAFAGPGSDGYIKTFTIFNEVFHDFLLIIIQNITCGIKEYN